MAVELGFTIGMAQQRGLAGGRGFLWQGHTCLRPSPELGQDKVTLDSLPRIHENTGEVGILQGRAQLLQHQGPPQLGPLAPVLPPGVALPQPAWEVLDEGAVAQPVEDAEVGKAVSETSSAGQVTVSAGHCLAAGSASGREEQGAFAIPGEAAVVA